MTWGLVGALASAVCYGTGTILQAVAARRTARAHQVNARFFASLLSQTPYLLSLLVEAIGFLASVLALRSLPLFLVQAAVAANVGVTALLAVMFLGARLRVPELTALVVLGLGLVLLGISAQPGGSKPLQSWEQWLLLAGVAVLIAVGFAAARLPDRWACAGLAAAAGAAFGGVGIAARALEVPPQFWRIVLEPLSWAILGYGVLAMLLFAMSLQRGAVTTTAAVAVVVETLLPAIVGLLVLGDSARPGRGPLAVAGFVMTIVGAVVLAHFAEPEPHQQLAAA